LHHSNGKRTLPPHDLIRGPPLFGSVNSLQVCPTSAQPRAQQK
jgi:hypothetical protein